MTRHLEGIEVLCIGGPLDGQDYTVKGDGPFRPSFFIREFSMKGTKIHEYLIDKLYLDEPTPFDVAERPYTFVARHASLSKEHAGRILDERHMQKFVDRLILPC